MKFSKLTTERMNEIQEQTRGSVQFKLVDGSLKSVYVETPIGVLTIEIDSYSLVALEEAKKKVYGLHFEEKDELTGDISCIIRKEFDSEYDRDNYISAHKYELFGGKEPMLFEQTVKCN